VLQASPQAWAATLVAIAALFALDLVVSARRPGVPSVRAAGAWSLFYIGAAAVFGVVLGAAAGWGAAGQYFAGYTVEKSLSVDNLFVFVIIIANFAVPAEQQRQALTLGIALALGLRAVFILLGAALINALSFMFLVFGAVLLVTAVQLFRHRAEDPKLEDNLLVTGLRRVFPIARRYQDGKLVARVEGRRVLTPLLLVLVAIGSTDLVFAFDSIPAVFGLTQSTFIVFCANAFALLGLRALFFLVTGTLDRLVYLSTGLSLVLALIAVKLILHYAHTQDASVPEITTAVSLAAIAAILAVTVLASMVANRRDPSRRAHAGAIGHQRGRLPPPETG
jgi:tellurite resistance protein TerC